MNKIKYLGIIINDGQDMFKLQKEEMINKAKRYSNLTYSIIAKSYNKILLGKTFWKGVAHASILYGAGLMSTTGKELNGLQVVENGVYRKILGARSFTANPALRRDIGSSLMETRIMKARLMLVKSIHEGRNELVKEVLRNIRKDRFGQWNCTLNMYLRKIGITYDELINMSRNQVDKKVKEYDSKLWEREMSTKSSLRVYRKYKKAIKEEKDYDNRNSSVLLFQARTNSLNLNGHKKNKVQERICKLCNKEDEDIIHFIFKCKRLEVKRDTELIRTCNGEDLEDKLGKLLYETEDIERVKDMLQKLWQLRYHITKTLPKNTQ